MTGVFLYAVEIAIFGEGTYIQDLSSKASATSPSSPVYLLILSPFHWVYIRHCKLQQRALTGTFAHYRTRRTVQSTVSVDLHKSTPVQPNTSRYKPQRLRMKTHLAYPLDSASIKLFTGMCHLGFSVSYSAIELSMGLVPVSEKSAIPVLQTRGTS